MSIASFAFKFIKSKIFKAGLREDALDFQDFKVQFYDNESDQPVIVLLNGFGVSTEFQWHNLIPKLSQNYRVVLINLLHFGESAPSNPKNCTISDQVNLVYRLTEKLGISSMRLAGISYGGLVASEFAEKHGGLVSELILLDAPTKYLDLKDLKELCHKNGVASVHHFFAPTTYQELKTQFKLAYYSSPWLPDFVITSFHSVLCKPYLTNWNLMIDSLLNDYDNLKSKTYNFAGKTTLIWGENDLIISTKVGEKLKAMYPSATLYLIPKCGHLPSIEQPKKVLELL